MVELHYQPEHTVESHYLQKSNCQEMSAIWLLPLQSSFYMGCARMNKVGFVCTKVPKEPQDFATS